MSYKRIPKEIKGEIIAKAEGGAKVVDLAGAYGVSGKTIYTWLSKTIEGAQVSLMQFNRLKRERDDLLMMVGALTLKSNKRKKKRNY
jgi:transposase-like protein